MKQELLNTLKSKTLNQLPHHLPGHDFVRGYCGDINGYYTNGYHDSIYIVDKKELTLTFEIDKDEFQESEELFENTNKYDEGIKFEDWNGKWCKTLDNHCSFIFLTHLLKL